MEPLSSVDKAIDVLFALHAGGGAVGVTALGRELGLPKASTHRLLASLARRGLVERAPGGRYRPGLGLVALGLGVLERDPLVAASRPELEAEAREIGETVFLVAARAGRLVVLDKAEGQGFLRAAPRVGSEVPVHATAVGKLFLADGAAGVAIESKPERFTSATRLTAAALAEELARARETGIAENRDEWIDGLSVIAAGIRVRGEIRGALAVAVPSARFAELGGDALASRARAAADRIGAGLEGRP